MSENNRSQPREERGEICGREKERTERKRGARKREKERERKRERQREIKRDKETETEGKFFLHWSSPLKKRIFSTISVIDCL